MGHLGHLLLTATDVMLITLLTGIALAMGVIALLRAVDNRPGHRRVPASTRLLLNAGFLLVVATGIWFASHGPVPYRALVATGLAGLALISTGWLFSRPEAWANRVARLVIMDIAFWYRALALSSHWGMLVSALLMVPLLLLLAPLAVRLDSRRHAARVTGGLGHIVQTVAAASGQASA